MTVGMPTVLLTMAGKSTVQVLFLLLPMGFSWLHVHEGLLALGAVMIASILKKLGSNKASMSVG
ncbi:hypothetical protein HJC23_000242 [Cyclotella cryptica]|uniref:Uncharacterized protein n=1 Tax=Cyclotella cryptica TaxID=29204 RepID=A0ABD3PMG4_9STRA|eukprot:CCRYP_013410-RA/>CCRYP_013410-RA protein AED:0.39 eAED:0.42 QI:0/0/0/1/1/1/2/0/63